MIFPRITFNGIWIHYLEAAVFPSNLWNATMIWQFILYKSNDFKSSKECHYLQIFPANLTVIRSAIAFGLWNVLNNSVFWKKEQILGQFKEKNTQKQDRYYAIIKVNELRNKAIHK